MIPYISIWEWSKPGKLKSVANGIKFFCIKQMKEVAQQAGHPYFIQIALDALLRSCPMLPQSKLNELHRELLNLTFHAFGHFSMLLLHRGGARNFPTGELAIPTRGLKYDFQGTINAKNLRKKSLFTFRRGLACSDGGYSPLALPWRHLCYYKI